MADKIYDVVIVGAGTAGLSAAIYALRAGMQERTGTGGENVWRPDCGDTGD